MNDSFSQAPYIVFYADRFYGPLYESLVKAGLKRGWRLRLMQRQAMVPGTRCLEYGYELVHPAAATYDAIIVAVGHQSFRELGAKGIRAFGKSSSVLYDVKSILPVEAVDGRL